MSATDCSLVGDIGATYARFCLVKPDGGLADIASLPSREHASLADALGSYLGGLKGSRPRQALLAVAGTSVDDRMTLTNNAAWSFSIEELRKDAGLGRLRVVNDLYAQAAAIPHLAESERTKVGAGTAVADAPVGLIGPGTGLGVSALVPASSGPMPVAGEGGHVTMAAADARESAVLDPLRRRFGHVSAERLLSGPGLVNIYGALCEVSGAAAGPLTPAEITDPRTHAADACAREATAMFCAMLGTVAGNLALTLGARGGIYIVGGIVPMLGEAFAQSQFRERFEAKGRMRGYLAAMPTYVVTHAWVGLLGAAKLLDQP
ncbi:MAG: glucokinase [Hyphomicrobium sp.]